MFLLLLHHNEVAWASNGPKVYIQDSQPRISARMAKKSKREKWTQDWSTNGKSEKQNHFDIESTNDRMLRIEWNAINKRRERACSEIWSLMNIISVHLHTCCVAMRRRVALNLSDHNLMPYHLFMGIFR